MLTQGEETGKLQMTDQFMMEKCLDVPLLQQFKSYEKEL